MVFMRLPALAPIIVVMLAWLPVASAGDKLPASLIRIPESIATLFVAETSTARFHRFDHLGKNLVLEGSYTMSIGRLGTGKQRSGDRRTPLGAYFVTEQLDTSKLHEKYGVTAFPLDYPNAWDARKHRDGDGIWVHGVDPASGPRPAQDTDGCIALTNEDLGVLEPVFEENTTPVLVTRAIRWVEAPEVLSIRNELEEKVTAWARSQADRDLQAYLSLYDSEFERWGMSYAEWSSLSLQSERLRSIQEVSVTDLLLLAYPEEDGLYLSRFQLTVAENDKQTVTMTRLYWRRDTNGALKIIAENEG